MSARQIVVVDVETNGLDHDRHQAVEVAWWNLTTDARGTFIPPHSVRRVLAAADVRALQVSRYIDRIADAEQGTHDDVLTLKEQFEGGRFAWRDAARPPLATLLGSNPRFDALMLAQLPVTPVREKGARLGEVWHHRLWDLSAYAAGALGLDELPGLARVCELLDIPGPDHTAAGDVTATGLCFRTLQAAR